MMEKSADEKLNWKLFFVFGILLFSYTLIRACVLSITWDEAYTYLEFVKKGIFIPSTFNAMSANNHLLNTWLDILFVKCFGANEFTLRIPALIGHLLFLFYSSKLVRNFPVNGFALDSCLVLNKNPYLLDFFSLSRGYGLSFGLMMASIYYLQQFISAKNKNRDATLSVLFAALSVLANLVLLNYSIALTATVFILSIFIVRKEKSNSFSGMIILPACILTLLLAFMIPFAFNLKEATALFYGGRIGFYTDTICETTHHFFYETGNSLWIERITKLFSILLFLASLVLVTIKFYRKQMTSNTLFLFALIFIFTSCLLSTILQHYFLDIFYLTARTALSLVILLTLIFVFLFSEFANLKSLSFFYFSTILIVFHFFFAMNFNYVLDWKSDADTKAMLHELDIIHTESAANSPSLISSRALSESEEFYKEINHFDWLYIYPENWMESKLWINSDYLYLNAKDFASYKEKGIGCKAIKTFPLTGNVLAKRN